MSEETLGNKARIGAIASRPSEALGQRADSAAPIAIADSRLERLMLASTWLSLSMPERRY